MSTILPHAPGEFGEPPTRPATGSAHGPGYYARKGVRALASLQLTVVLFVLGANTVLYFATGTRFYIPNDVVTKGQAAACGPTPGVAK